MTKPARKAAGKPVDRQEAQRQMVESAKQMPGVAEVMKVYGSIKQFGDTRSYQTSRLRYATGGNSDY